MLSKSCHIAIGTRKNDEHEIIGLMIQNNEGDETWFIFFD